MPLVSPNDLKKMMRIKIDEVSLFGGNSTLVPTLTLDGDETDLAGYRRGGPDNQHL
jgi:hypothetical protein